MEHYLEAIRHQARIERAHEGVAEVAVANSIGARVARGDNASMLMCDGDLLVLVAFATGSVISENSVQETRPPTPLHYYSARFCILIQGVDNPDQALIHSAIGELIEAGYSPE